MASRSSKEEDGEKMRSERIFSFSTITAIFAVILADQLTKIIFFNKNIEVIRKFFSISSVKNTGAVFGMMQNQNTSLIFLSLFALGVIIYYYDKIPWVYFSLITGGITGNLIDRIRLGFVADFLDFSFFGWRWPAFNVADSAITIGVIGLMIYFWEK